jgi:hypothetical protein
VLTCQVSVTAGVLVGDLRDKHARRGAAKSGFEEAESTHLRMPQSHRSFIHKHDYYRVYVLPVHEANRLEDKPFSNAYETMSLYRANNHTPRSEYKVLVIHESRPLNAAYHNENLSL